MGERWLVADEFSKYLLGLNMHDTNIGDWHIGYDSFVDETTRFSDILFLDKDIYLKCCDMRT